MATTCHLHSSFKLFNAWRMLPIISCIGTNHQNEWDPSTVGKAERVKWTKGFLKKVSNTFGLSYVVVQLQKQLFLPVATCVLWCHFEPIDEQAGKWFSTKLRKQGRWVAEAKLQSKEAKQVAEIKQNCDCANRWTAQNISSKCYWLAQDCLAGSCSSSCFLPCFVRSPVSW